MTNKTTRYGIPTNEDSYRYKVMMDSVEIKDMEIIAVEDVEEILDEIENTLAEIMDGLDEDSEVYKAIENLYNKI